MRRIRISTWALTAIFLAALAAFLLVKPSSASIIGPQQPIQHTRSTSPVRGTLLPGVTPGASPHSSPASAPPAASGTLPAR